VDSTLHYRALQHIIFNAPNPDDWRERIVALDAALGNGAMLNALVKRYAYQYAGQVHFQTSWDVLYGRATEEQPTER
jgi:hypothetical protein